jgi:large subunit ribosomal protein L15
MQSKRKKRSRIRASKVTAGKGHKKKNRGAGHRGGRGASGGGKRGDFKIMKLNKQLGKQGFTSLKKNLKTINLQELQTKLPYLLQKNFITKHQNVYIVDLTKLGYDKLLSKGLVKEKLEIQVNAASQNAAKKVESIGGKVQISE